MSDEQPAAPSQLTGAALIARAPRVRELLARLRASGVSLDGVWIVGGVIRDAALGVDAGPDIDLAVEGSGATFAHQIAAALDGDVVAEHAFGTATVIVDLAGDRVGIDVATTRTETYAEPGALPSVTPGASIHDDLRRRDVTINAIAVRLAPDAAGAHELADPYGGLRDLDTRVLRILHDGSFTDDPTRIFRVARYAGRLDLHVDDNTRQLAIDAIDAGALGTVSAERVRAELELLLNGPAWNALTLLDAWGVLRQLDPRLSDALRPPLLLSAIDDACGTDPHRNARAWTLRLTALARPLGADAAGWMSWLGFPAPVTGAVVEHVRILDAVLTRPDELREQPNSELYLDLGELREDSIALAALAIGDTDAALLDRLMSFFAAVQSTHLAIRGTDVMAAGVPAGPRVGRILGTIFLRSLDGEIQGEADERRALAELAVDDPAAADADPDREAD